MLLPFVKFLRYRSAKFVSVLASALVGASFLSACTPEYNWREVNLADNRARVLLPAKPASMDRQISLDGLSVKMTMTGGKVGDITFTVAHALLPDSKVETQQKALAAMRLQMVRNINGTEISGGAIDATKAPTLPPSIAVIDASGRAVSSRAGQFIVANGAIKKQNLEMQAGFVADGDRVYQWVALAPKLPAEQTKQFLQSFRLVQP